MDTAIVGSIVGAIVVGLLTFLARRIWQPVPSRVKRWWTTWRVRRTQRAATKLYLEDGVLRKHCLVFAKFQAEPAEKWRDPEAEIESFWAGRRTVSLTPPLRVLTHDGTAVVDIKRDTDWGGPRCIPSYKVEPEWRDEAHVRFDPFWRSLKDYVVTRFLERTAGKQFLCSVVISREKGEFHLNCQDYDEYLKDQLPYFKGLEAALTNNRILKQQDVITKNNRDLKTFVFWNLPSILLNRATMERIPKQYRRAIETRPPDPVAVYLALKGLIQRRYKDSGIPSITA